MPLENNPTTIKELDPTWPLNTDGATDGNEHFHGVKQVLRSTFPDSGGVGQWDGNLFLGPDGAGNATKDAFIRDLRVERNATIVGRVNSNAQVSIGAVKFNGLDGSILGADDNITSVTRVGTGQYNIVLGETGWEYDDLVVCGVVNNGIGGIGILGSLPINTTTIQVITTSPNTPTAQQDCATCEVEIFDRGRD